MRKPFIGGILLAGLLSAIIGSATSVAQSAAQSAADALESDEMIQQMSRDLDVPVDEMAMSTADSGLIYDFMMAHETDPNFGAIWVEYGGGYKVHIRQRGPALTADVESLRAQLAGELILHEGGASYEELRGFARETFDAKASIGYKLDDREGVVIV